MRCLRPRKPPPTSPGWTARTGAPGTGRKGPRNRSWPAGGSGGDAGVAQPGDFAGRRDRAPPRGPVRCARRGAAPGGSAGAGWPRNRAAGRASDSGRCRAGRFRRKADLRRAARVVAHQLDKILKRPPEDAAAVKGGADLGQGPPGAPARQQRRDRVARLVAAGLGVEIDLHHCRRSSPACRQARWRGRSRAIAAGSAR